MLNVVPDDFCKNYYLENAFLCLETINEIINVTFLFLYKKSPLYLYFMLSGRISRNIGENIFPSYTGITSENTDFHVLVAQVNCACLTTR